MLPFPVFASYPRNLSSGDSANALAIEVVSDEVKVMTVIIKHSQIYEQR